MRVLPRSLFGRTALLILLVLVLSQAGAFALFHYFRDRDFAGHVATLLAAQVQAVTASISAVDDDDRDEYVGRLRSSGYLRLLPDNGRGAPARLSENALSRRVEPLLSARLGYPARLRLQPDRLWIRFRADGAHYWLVLRRPERQHPLPWQWFAVGGLMALLALGGAFALVWRINRPLRQLTAAVSLLGRGAAPPALRERGAEEISALSRAFNQMAEDLRQLDTDRALLLAGVSHDLRTPLARLRLGVEMLEGEIDAGTQAGMVQDIEDIDAVVGQFLAYVRDDAGEPVEAAANLNALVETAVERYRRLGVTVIPYLAPLPPLALRPTAMQRLLTNLIDNAVRYGGGEVEIETVQAGESVRLRVLDRGPGIPPAQQPAMLQPFTRLEPSRSGGGTGLGLAIVVRIARMHGGEVRLSNRAGGGLAAQVTLPCTASPVTPGSGDGTDQGARGLHAGRPRKALRQALDK